MGSSVIDCYLIGCVNHQQLDSGAKSPCRVACCLIASSISASAGTDTLAGAAPLTLWTVRVCVSPVRDQSPGADDDDDDDDESIPLSPLPSAVTGSNYSS